MGRVREVVGKVQLPEVSLHTPAEAGADTHTLTHTPTPLLSGGEIQTLLIPLAFVSAQKSGCSPFCPWNQIPEGRGLREEMGPHLRSLWAPGLACCSPPGLPVPSPCLRQSFSIRSSPRARP